MMTSSRFTATSAAAIGISLAGSAAFADVTAEEVWSDWRSYMEAAGYDLTATETRDGNTLIVSDTTMSMELPEDEGTVTMSMAR